jgi:hypothetical protein
MYNIGDHVRTKADLILSANLSGTVRKISPSKEYIGVLFPDERQVLWFYPSELIRESAK